jgi:hypothetical protein
MSKVDSSKAVTYCESEMSNFFFYGFFARRLRENDELGLDVRQESFAIGEPLLLFVAQLNATFKARMCK